MKELYVCDPDKNVDCTRYLCQELCKHTTKKEFAKKKGDVVMRESYLIFKRVNGVDTLFKPVPTEGEAQTVCRTNNAMIGPADQLHTTIWYYKKLDPTPGFYNL